MSETRDQLEREIGARAVGTAVIDDREVPVAFAAHEEMVVALLRLAADRGWRVLPIGSGTKLDAGPPREKPRFAISLRALSGVTAYERGDGTITARAGSTMSALAEVARAGGNHLTPDVARAPHATLGGTIASGVSGIDRLRYGPLRHHVLGLRVALCDGRVTKTGGRLVKNVTGFDLHRLYTGSRGSLCVILEATLRLFPLPRRGCVLETSFFGRAAALAAARAVAESPARATCIVVHGATGGPWTLTLGLAGRDEVVSWEVAHVRGLVGELSCVEGDDARARIEALRDDEAMSTLRAGVLPSRLERALADVDELAGDAAGPVFLHPALATVAVSPAAARSVILAERLRDSGASVQLAGADLAARSAFDPLAATPPSARELMARIKLAVDPARRFVSDRAPAEVSRA